MKPASSLERARERLREASARLERVREPGWGECASRLDVQPSDEGLFVHWLLNEDAWFEARDEGEKIFSDIFRLLASPQIAPWLRSLTLEGHEIATNGTIDWEIEPIAYAKSRFARLKAFRLEAVGAADGNPCSAGTLRGRGWEDTSVAMRLLDRMPVLEELAIPTPPKEIAFFQGQPHPLRKLSVLATDFDSFVLRLAACRRFPRLEEVLLTESDCTDTLARLPGAHYVRLLDSDALPALRGVTLGQVDLTEKDVPLLRRTRVGRQLCRLTVKPAKPWCNRPILRAPPEDEHLLRELSRNPWQPTAVDPAWLAWNDSAILKLAQAISEEGRSAGHPILADALEDAGCTGLEILAHCRQPGEHVQGCWVINSLLQASSQAEARRSKPAKPRRGV